ncbi:CRISPR-associated endonuclease Cas3'' [Nanoarchaeota archaeon]
MEKMPKNKLLSEYEEGDIVRDIFVVKIKKGISDYSKGYYFSLVLTDASGKSMDYKYWGGPDEVRVKQIYDSIKNDSVINIAGAVSSYQGKLQITSNEQHPIRVLSREEYNEADFIKKSQKNLDESLRELERYIDRVGNEKLKLLLRSVFDEEFKSKFQKHPAGVSIHHNWIGGLLEHTLEVLKYCELSKQLFPKLDLDLLIVGAVLHDIGKVEEMEMTTKIKRTNLGKFTDHTILGSIFVYNKMNEIGFEENLKDKVLHMMVSHHGKIEKGATREPMFPEAVALHYADEMSSRLSEMFNFIEENQNETDEDFLPKWPKSNFVNVFFR